MPRGNEAPRPKVTENQYAMWCCFLDDKPIHWTLSQDHGRSGRLAENLKVMPPELREEIGLGGINMVTISRPEMVIVTIEKGRSCQDR